MSVIVHQLTETLPKENKVATRCGKQIRSPRNTTMTPSVTGWNADTTCPLCRTLMDQP